MARIHVQSWQETYRGILPDRMLDRQDFVADRERFWTNVLTDEWYRHNLVAVAEADGAIVGVAMSGLPEEDDTVWPRQLYIHYVLASHHGSGAGDGLLDAVIPPGEHAGLWIVASNQRALAFYRKRDFEPDGKDKYELDENIRSIRLERRT